MKTFKTYAAQGEITVTRLGDVPAAKRAAAGYTKMAPENGHFVIGHSETGHHHVLEAEHTIVAAMDYPPAGMRILRLIVESATPLTHLRPFDTHEQIMLDPGEYEVRIAREYDPYQELARSVAD